MDLRRSLLPVAVSVLVAGLAAGCSGSSSPNATPLPTAPTTAASQPPSSSSSPSPSPTPTVTTTVTPTKKPKPAGKPCATSQLQLSLGQSQGAAGHFEQPVVLTNTSTATCTLYGYPGVSYTGSGGAQLGFAASHSGGHRHVVSLAPGNAASALLQQPDPGVFPPASCDKQTSVDLRVYPPGQTAARAVADATEVCTTKQGRAMIGVMENGTDPQQ